MRTRQRTILTLLLALALLLTACSTPNTDSNDNDTLQVVTTTTMLADLAGVIGGDAVEVTGLMGPGIDPHLYQASAGDVSTMDRADVVVYNGIDLEGKMGDIFASLADQGRQVIAVEDILSPDQLYEWDEDRSVYDPHVWFDVTLWQEVAQGVAAGFSEVDPDEAATYEANLTSYLQELDELHQYMLDRAQEVPAERRILVTAHDAFNYFGLAYGFEVRGLQGISTEAEAGTADVTQLANYIVEQQIPAIFIETSLPTRNIEALQAAVAAQGFEVTIGGELYSDSLGSAGTEAETYIGTLRSNIDTIVDALQ